MSYVVVEDVAASWEHYRSIADALADPPRGLILHVAGPTDEGFRIIDIWESETAWAHFRAERLAALPVEEESLRPPLVCRELRPAHVVYGAPRVADTPTTQGGHQ